MRIISNISFAWFIGQISEIFASFLYQHYFSFLNFCAFLPKNLRKICWSLMPGKSRRRRTLVGCGPWGRTESDTTERLHFHFSLSCIGEGNGNPLQCSCLENPRDGGAWWAAVYGVAESRTRLRWLSRSSSNACHSTVEKSTESKSDKPVSKSQLQHTLILRAGHITSHL